MSLWSKATDALRTVFLVESFREDVRRLEAANERNAQSIEQLTARMGDLRERLARLEAYRDADRNELRAMIQRMSMEAERLGLTNLQPPPKLPPPADES